MATFISGTTGIDRGGLVSMKPPSIGIPAVDKAVLEVAKQEEAKRRSSSRSTSASHPQQAQAFESTLLQQSFISEQARLTAEKAFRAKQARDKAAAQRAAQQRQAQKTARLSVAKKKGFSGQVEVRDPQGELQETRFHVEGRQVATQKAGTETFEPALLAEEKARLEFEREGELTRVVEVTPEQLREMEITRGQQRAGALLVGGPSPDEGINPQTGLPWGSVDPVGEVNQLSINAMGGESREMDAGTEIRSDFGEGDFPVHTPGTIYGTSTDVVTSEKTGRQAPYVEYKVIGEDFQSRKATTSEVQTLQDYQKATTFKEVAISPPPSKVSRIYGEAKGTYQQLAVKEIYDKEKVQRLFGEGKVGKFAGGVVTGVVPSTKGALIGTGIITIATAGAGFAIKGVTAGVVGGTTRLFGAKAGVVAGTSVRVSAMGTGAFLTGGYVLGKGVEYKSTQDYSGKGEVVGSTIREISAGIVGFKAGSKVYDITEGLYRTKGRSFIDLPQGEYPAAPSQKHLELFKRNVVKEFGVEPGAFHTTSSVFWKSGKITPELGTSELGGLYGSTQVSTPFSRIQGSGGKAKLLPSWTDILTPPGKPGVAFLKPKDFQIGKYTWKDVPAFEGQKKVGGRFAWWKTPPKEGTAYIPKMKTEIEAVYRKGDYGFESGKYYTDIKGVRVPIDVFKYDSLVEGKPTGKPLVSSDYYSYKSPPLVDVTSGIVSYSKITPSYLPSITSTTKVSKVSSAPKSSSVSSYISSVVSSMTSVPKSSYKSPSRALPKSSLRSSTSSSRAIISSLSSARKSYAPSYTSYRPGSSSRGYSSYLPPTPPPPTIILPWLKPGKPQKLKPIKFPVFGRRFGEYKIVGYGRTPRQAVGVGKAWAGRTLGVTFKVPSFKGLKLPGFRTKKEKSGVVFIEPRKRRIKKGTRELPELQYWKGVKSPVKKRKAKRRKK